jgi:hypothetical protein
MPSEEMGHRRRPQPPDVANRIVIAAAAGFLGLVLLSMTGLFFYLRTAVPGAFKATVEHPFPEPELQKNPQVDLQNFERDQRATLSGYGWVNQPKGIVRIPVEQAMRMIAARGPHAYDAPDQPEITPLPAGAGGVRP